MTTDTNLEEKVENSGFLGRFSPKKIYYGLVQRLEESNERLKEDYKIAQKKRIEKYNKLIEQQNYEAAEIDQENAEKWVEHENIMAEKSKYLAELNEKVENMRNTRLAKESMYMEKIADMEKRNKELEKEIYSKELAIESIKLDGRKARDEYYKKRIELLRQNNYRFV
ncbi:MAG: hypothetical protein KJ583_02885 [Nanoarchaeota archaeon]|nr:hypothetical protein [Nanoarchaeota archaeon]MBU1270040.1 hypothetical protein [Nanoarchaeota archaeon]MBU1604240.1 hypothetical protein [Nanoarchaeota archaeon]MBU2443776.1 hypothetical protein [Nanoarchaeota archaeon]